MNEVEKRVTLKWLHTLQIVQSFIHHLDTISYESESLERHRERLAMEAVGGDAKHYTGYSGRYIK
jgi:hypothetical protein